ncbi:MAG: hypothetical protein WBG50_17755 [Desulfomonilaceae bacterium]
MKAKIYANQIKIGGPAWEYLQLVKGGSRTTKKIEESHGAEAQEILKTIREQKTSRYE